MPLSCDCYPGCWDAHSENWFWVDSSHNVDELYRVAVRLLPYGTYVKMPDHLRVEDRVGLEKVVTSPEFRGKALRYGGRKISS